MPDAPLKVLAVEPWLGGSHEQFLEGWRQRSAHRVEILGLQARHWQWRMEAAAFTLGQQVKVEALSPDVIVASDYVDVPRLRGFLPPPLRDLPILIYLHENQLTYPSQGPGTERNHYGFTNILSCLSADAIAFNSRFHLQDFGEAARQLLRSLPRPVPRREFDEAMESARVIYPGIELAALPLGKGPPSGSPLRVVFNHRWEHDKDPIGFLDAVISARALGAEIEVVLLGGTFERLPEGLRARLDQLGGSVLRSGFEPDRAAYGQILGDCDLVVSTARHEFYGMALLEGLACGCSALAPARLAYPEHLSSEQLYARDADLVQALVRASGQTERWRDPDRRAERRDRVRAHGADQTASQLDALCESLCGAPSAGR